MAQIGPKVLPKGKIDEKLEFGLQNRILLSHF